MRRKSLSAPSKAIVKRPRTLETRSQVYEAADRDRRRAVTQIERLSEKLVLTEAVLRLLSREKIDLGRT
ncbi:MAG: hypothetical protein HYY68_05980 [Thaumarchaeota archaeon]|nr:hypothetical protein [Nitrososphaerota archaeon]